MRMKKIISRFYLKVKRKNILRRSNPGSHRCRAPGRRAMFISYQWPQAWDPVTKLESLRLKGIILVTVTTTITRGFSSSPPLLALAHPGVSKLQSQSTRHPECSCLQCPHPQLSGIPREALPVRRVPRSRWGSGLPPTSHL